MADAGGLGEAEQHDIKTTPTISLKQAMALAQERDSIAKQYLNNYHEIFYIGLPNLTSAINCEESIEWATALAYLTILSSVPDTLVCRKQSREHANAVSKKATDLVNKTNNTNKLSHLKDDIIAWDNELKKEAINPGTTADLTAAALLLYAFQSRLSSHRISVS